MGDVRVTQVTVAWLTRCEVGMEFGYGAVKDVGEVINENFVALLPSRCKVDGVAEVLFFVVTEVFKAARHQHIHSGFINRSVPRVLQQTSQPRFVLTDNFVHEHCCRTGRQFAIFFEGGRRFF